jgi:hypothetical protein
VVWRSAPASVRSIAAFYTGRLYRPIAPRRCKPAEIYASVWYQMRIIGSQAWQRQ